MRLEDKVALITGGASGMGASMARIFAREGAKVVVADMLEDEGKEVAAEITRANGAAIFQQLDVSSEAEWRAAIEATLGRLRQARHPGQRRRHQRQRGRGPVRHAPPGKRSWRSIRPARFSA